MTEMTDKTGGAVCAAERSTREQLILAGLDELNEYGIRHFSTRRVAKRCGVSCATPYKHFTDSHEFIAEIFGYINGLYLAQQEALLHRVRELSTREQLVEVSVNYIRFLTDYPVFRRIIMQNFQACDEEYRVLRGKLSTRTYEVVSRYCEEVGMPEDVRKRKTFIVRAIIYSAALFFDNGELEYTEENIQKVRELLEREFDLP